jgi:hypothetical protein
MQNHEQLLEDERIAIALSQIEAEQYDNFVFDEHEEHKDLLSYPQESQFFDRLPHRNPELDFLNEVEERRVRMEERMKNHFEDFEEPGMFEFIEDEIPEYVLQAMFENVDNERPRNRIEEVKREPIVVNRIEEVKIEPIVVNRIERNRQRVNLRNLGHGLGGNRDFQRYGRGKRGAGRRSETINEAANYMFDDDNTSYEQLTKLDEDNFEKGNGFSELKLGKLRVELYRNLNPKNKETCSICMSEFNTREPIIKLSCTHIFHKDCIKEWLSRKKTCAVCKIEVKL